MSDMEVNESKKRVADGVGLKSMVQSHLDLGQREVGEKRCGECGMVYSVGVDEDEKTHLVHHRGEVLSRKRPRLSKLNRFGRTQSFDDGFVVKVPREFHTEVLEKVLSRGRSSTVQSGPRAGKKDSSYRGNLFVYVQDSTSQAAAAMLSQVVSAEQVGRNPVWQKQLKSTRKSSETLEPSYREVLSYLSLDALWTVDQGHNVQIPGRLLTCVRAHSSYGSMFRKDQCLIGPSIHPETVPLLRSILTGFAN
ncbi:hypothetical protein NDN08_006184 [Rhodosorus marinus]|uniref:N-acetyltransferase ESCO zinc-finger domain-containing protein n=1 Tax=Rhodosorus marinus TaxID=101924 RepID=A0AAV8UKD9_9RHOD|nr:hypothetical protein NDN08_006184 [Rhodosorus marinus]